jgi:hypothetical protein
VEAVAAAEAGVLVAGGGGGTEAVSRLSAVSRPEGRRLDASALAGLLLDDVLSLAKFVDHEVASPLFDDFLDLGALVSPKDYETVVLGVNAVVSPRPSR